MNAARLFDVSGHVALVTGAASGLGLAMAEVMAENGALVVMADMDGPGLERAGQRLRSAGCRIETGVIDVADRETVERWVADAARRHGRLDAVFANAGMSAGPQARALATSWDTWDRVLAVNLTGVFATLRAAAAVMKAQGRGRIIVTASIAGLRGEPMVGYAYAATKAAVANLVRQAAIELGPFNVLVNAIAPGPFRTNIAGGRMHTDKDAEREFAESCPLGRIAEPDEIKGLALLLASPAASYMTGSVIPIDGGSLAW
ncbi:MAG TPA: SDR family NAD(P)-dependent oxidoreductase [Alphaproteobacteria bacterium]|nr:SDR family NAD(P)-dependent oxidoreductase [Alphaproteobacteria bacterium]